MHEMTDIELKVAHDKNSSGTEEALLSPMKRGRGRPPKKKNVAVEEGATQYSKKGKARELAMDEVPSVTPVSKEQPSKLAASPKVESPQNPPKRGRGIFIFDYSTDPYEPNEPLLHI